jgi:ribosomal protein S8
MNDITDIQNRIRDILILDSINNAQKLKLHEEAEKNLKPKIVSYLLEDGFVESFKANFGGIDLKQI